MYRILLLLISLKGIMEYIYFQEYAVIQNAEYWGYIEAHGIIVNDLR
jgi:hypothetical protein